VLTDAACRAAKPKAQRYELDAGGIHRGLKLRVTPDGVKVWTLRYRVQGEQRRATLGEFPAMKLGEAQTIALEYRGLVRKKIDPQAKRDALAELPKLADAIASYLSTADSRLRPRTVPTYRAALARFQEWAGKNRVVTTEGLSRAVLSAYRNHCISLPRHAQARGGKRGARKATSEKRSPLSVNRELIPLKAFLNTLRREGRTPNLDRDAIADNLRLLTADQPAPEFLKPAEIKALLAAAKRHDAATWNETRAEHAGERPKGTTPKYQPIEPFALFLLLSGCRVGEALALQWVDVDLDAADHSGKAVGEIRLRAERVKTRRARTVDLAVSPALRSLLQRMKANATAAVVFEGYAWDLVTKARQRLLADGAPSFTWKILRSTCGSYLTNAPGIFGAASAFLASKQLGHSVVVAEKHYHGVIRGIPATARTLEAAMQIDDEKPRRKLALVAKGGR